MSDTYTAAELNALYPGLIGGGTIVSPPRNGVNRSTGALLQGWDHVEQSMSVIFMTHYHERIIRRWIGSYVPHILGDNIVARTITRFFWAIASAIDLFEPDYRIKRVYFMGDAIQASAFPDGSQISSQAVANLIRQGGVIFQNDGVYYPRGHLGDYTPYQRQLSAIVGRGGGMWDVMPTSNP